jgi:hypothetical protein
MQTFLPYADLDDSMKSLDSVRLGKQRVETLQLLRAALLPSYGWQSHPVTRMWRGYLPGLAAYGLANTREWISRGHADTTAALIREFAPQVDGLDQDELEAQGLLPPWFGDESIHRSHRSNLIRKDPAFYERLFPGTPRDLDYVWPGVPEGYDGTLGVDGTEMRIIRASTEHELEHWREDGLIAIGEKSPRGKETPAWRAQVQSFFDDLAVGAEAGVLIGNGSAVERVQITGEPGSLLTEEGEVLFTRQAEFTGKWSRSDFAIPAQLQDPRSVFPAVLRP